MGNRDPGASARLRDQAVHGGARRSESEAGRAGSRQRPTRGLINALGAFCLVLSIGCGSSDAATGGASGAGGEGGSGGGPVGPGALVDNTSWEPTTEGEEFFGPPPPDAVCELTPLDCDAYYPFPEGECIEIQGSDPCIASVIPEQLDTFCVLAVYTRMPNPAEPMCNWITLKQPSLRTIRAGDQVEIRMRHNQLTAPVPGSARMMFTIGDQVALDYEVLIPSDFVFPSEIWTADKDYPAGTQLLFHVDNHGSNEYMLIEVNVL